MLKFDIEEKLVCGQPYEYICIIRRILEGIYWHSAGENYSIIITSLLFLSNLCWYGLLSIFSNCNLMCTYFNCLLGLLLSSLTPVIFVIFRSKTVILSIPQCCQVNKFSLVEE